MTLCADLTRAGYGPTPGRTLTHTAFYYHWYQAKMAEARQRLGTQTLTLSGVVLGTGGKETAKLLADLERQQTAAEAAYQADLVAQLPRSARRLVGPLAASAPQSDVDWLQAEIAAAPPGKRAFLEGALREAQTHPGSGPAA